VRRLLVAYVAQASHAQYWLVEEVLLLALLTCQGKGDYHIYADYLVHILLEVGYRFQHLHFAALGPLRRRARTLLTVLLHWQSIVASSLGGGWLDRRV
jgi:hypothetical protein